MTQRLLQRVIAVIVIDEYDLFDQAWLGSVVNTVQRPE
jgi:hypothetical protein